MFNLLITSIVRNHYQASDSNPSISTTVVEFDTPNQADEAFAKLVTAQQTLPGLTRLVEKMY